MTDELGLVDPMPPAVLATVSEIATRDGVSKQAVSKKVKALIEHGLAVERDARGNVARVNVAQYDFLRGRHDDPSKDQRPQAPAEPPARDLNSYEEALRQKTWYEATRKGLELDEQIGELVRADEIEAAATDCGAEITAIVRRLQNDADNLAAAVARDGAHGLRVALKQVENRMLDEIADALSALSRRGSTKPAEDSIE